jgi:hypothetical protein
MKVKLENVRLAFPALFEAKTVNGEGEPAFSASFLMPPDHAAVAALRQAFETIGKEKWGAKWAAVKKEIEAKDRTALHDGDTKADYGGFEGNLFVSARSKTRPLVIDRDKTPLAAQDGRPYAGCYVNASVELWAQDNNYGKRINASLRGVQFARDGDAFGGGGSASEDDFDFVEADAADLV